MTQDREHRDDPFNLKRRAKSILAERAEYGVDLSRMSSEDVEKLVHELQVQQVELEIRNEELRKTQFALEASRDKYSDLYALAPVAYFLLDKDGLIRETNLAAARLLGLGLKSLLKKPFTRFICKDSQESYYFHTRLAFHERKKQTCEIQLVQSGGMQLDVQVDTMAAQNDDGEWSDLRTVVTDISERKKAEKALRESEEKFRSLVENLGVGVCTTTLEGSFIQANPAFVKMAGYDSVEEVLATPAEQFYADPNHRSRFIAELLEHGRVSAFETFGRRKDGAVCLASVNSTLLKDNTGRPERILNVAEDITERKRTEEALRQNEERLRIITETISEVFWMADPEINRIIYVSSGYERVWGRTLTSLYENPKSFIDAICEEDRERVITDLKVQQEGRPFEHEYRIARHDGERRWIWDRGFPIRESTGKVTCYVGVAQDITDRKKAEQELRESEDRFRVLFEDAAEGILVADVETKKLKFANPAICKMFGYTMEEMVQLNISDIHPRESLQGVMTGFDAVGRIEKLLQPNVPCVRKDGSVFYADIVGRSVVIDNREMNAGFFTDMTERKQAEEALLESEQRFRAVFNNAAVGIDILDSSGRYIEANSALTDMLGYSKEELAKINPLDLTHPDDLEKSREHLARLMEGKIDSYRLEKRYIKKDGSILFTDIMVSKILSASGKHAYTIGVISDVTERRKSEEALRESEARFREFAEAVPQVVFELDAKGNITFANRSGLALGGYTPEDIAQGLKLTDLLAPEDHERIFENFNKVLLGEGLYGNEYTVVTKDGVRLPVAAYTSPIVKANKVIGVRGVCVDIGKLKEAEVVLQRSRAELEKLVTERTSEVESVNAQLRKEILDRISTQESLALSEQRFRAIFETAKDCVFLKDSSLKYTLVNPAMAHLLDLPESAILGKTDFDLFGTSAGEHLRIVDERVLNGDVVEEEHTRPIQGVLMTFLEIRVPLTNASGETIGICGISRNITERKAVSSPRDSSELSSRSQTMAAVISAANLVASSETNVLITGESGTGKDRLARYIHDHSSRSSGPFYTINCAAIPHELAESELFGHEQGAFTGAKKRKRGLLEIAEGGTILLNEIGDMPFHLQSKLLAFLDSMSFTRLGGERTLEVNVRLMAATNKNLAEEISADRFREDLFYRLNVFSIQLPPLRKRLDDLPMLVEELLSELALEFGYTVKLQQPQRIMETLSNYSWPGNIRELRNVLERALIISKGSPLKSVHFQIPRGGSSEDRLRVPMPIEAPLPDVLGDIERSLIKEALQLSYGNKKNAAKLLGVSRYLLARHMEKLGIHTFDD